MTDLWIDLFCANLLTDPGSEQLVQFAQGSNCVAGVSIRKYVLISLWGRDIWHNLMPVTPRENTAEGRGSRFGEGAVSTPIVSDPIDRIQQENKVTCGWRGDRPEFGRAEWILIAIVY